jgi:LAO/AO transport system kinase
MEVSDAIAVNKADGQSFERSKLHRAELAGSVRLLKHRYPTWEPPVIAVSALNSYNLDKLWG